MCKVLAHPVPVVVKDENGNVIGSGHIRGYANLPVQFDKDGKIVAWQEDPFTPQQLDECAKKGTYPGTQLGEPVIVMDNTRDVYYGLQVHYDYASNGG